MLELNGFKQKLLSLSENLADKKFLLAVSGGVDSMVLVSLFQELEYSFEVAHVNYHFRGEDSNLDQQLVENFCQKHQIPFHLKEVTEEEKSGMTSLQNWAREFRYDFFFDILRSKKLDFIVTAHHLNDTLETFIINLSRGSGIRGLSGIPHNKNQILRPLLQYSKEDIYQYATKHQIIFREDKSNQKQDYLRNFIRHEISPKLLETHDYFLEMFQKSIQNLSETQKFIEEHLSEIANEISEQKGEEIILDKKKFLALKPYLHFEFLRTYGFENKKEIEKILIAEVGKIFYSKEHQITIDREHYIISKKQNIEVINTERITLPVQEEIILKDFLPSFRVQEETWNIDPKKVTLPLYVRKKVDGDAFFPVGSSHKKLISKYLKDLKLSLAEKKEAWILCDTHHNIVGVVPYRQDRRNYTDETHNSIKIIL